MSSLPKVLALQFGSSGGSTPVTPFDPTSASQTFEAFDDFLNGVNSGEPYGVLGWDSISNGTGGGNVQRAVTTTEAASTKGIWRCTAGTSVGNYGGIIANLSDLFGGTTVSLKTRFKLVALADATEDFYFKIGFSNTWPTTQHGAYLIYDRSSSANWKTVTAKASVETVNTSSTAVDTNWHLAEVRVTNASTVGFYLDDVLLFSHTTNIPNAAGQVCGPAIFMNKTAGTANRSWEIDWSYVTYTFTAARGAL